MSRKHRTHHKTKSEKGEYSLIPMEQTFKRIQNGIRRFYPGEIIVEYIQLLNRPDADKLDSIIKYKPWEILLLIKWVFLYGDFSSHKLKQVTGNDLDNLRQRIYEMSGQVRMPSQYGNPFLFFRNLAFQQFWFQEQFSGPQISRQSLLFGHLEESHAFEKLFQQETNLSISEFIELSFALITRAFNKNPMFTVDWFSTIRASFSKGAVDYFLESLSRDIKGIRRYLNKNIGEKNISYEFYEQSPLKRYPLLRVNESYFFYSPTLFFRSMETFIYDILRAPNPHDFMDKFGPMFERYIERGILYAGIPYLKEDILIKHNDGGKVIDFVLVDEDVNILVDAKGVEMGYLGMVSHLPNVIKDKTKISVIKGIKQGYDTVKLLQKFDSMNGVKIGKGDSFLLIVTFKDLYIGNGKDFQTYIAKSTFEAIDEQYGGQLIPPQNMYFISINDLDQFFYCIKQGISARKILQRAVDDDNKPESMKFVFRQHLDELLPEVAKNPQYIVDEYENIINKVKSRFTTI